MMKQNCSSNNWGHLLKTLMQNVIILVLVKRRKCRMTCLFGAENDFISFDAQTYKHILDSKNTCHTTLFKFYSNF